MTKLPFLLKKRNLLRMLALAVAANLFAVGVNLYLFLYHYSDGSLLVVLIMVLGNLTSAVVCAWAWCRVYRLKDAHDLPRPL